MQYAFLFYFDEAARNVPDAVIQAEIAEHLPYIERLRRNRRYVAGDMLEPTGSHTARRLVLRTAGGRPVMTQGPFAESREQFGGYHLVEASDLDAAIAIASACPGLRGTGVSGLEIRPLVRAPWPSFAAAARPAHERFVVTAHRAEGDLDAWDDELARWAPWVERRTASEQLVAAAAFSPAGSATTLRIEEGKVILYDGPFVEQPDPLCAAFVLGAAGLDEAVALASDGPAAHGVEVRSVRRTVD